MRERKRMIIKRLIIKGLYGYYDYDISFNPDLTILYGSNGCGKTTVLNIINSIITGHISELYEYRFKDIKLFYSPIDKNDCSPSSKIQIGYKDGQTLFVQVGDEPSVLVNQNNKRFDNIYNMFFHAYLPLNRIVSKMQNCDANVVQIKTDDTAFDTALYYIHNEAFRVAQEQAKLDKKLHESIIDDAITLQEDRYSMTQAYNALVNKDKYLNNLDMTISDYFDNLSAFGLLTPTKEANIYDFVDRYKSEILQSDVNESINASVFAKFFEISKAIPFNAKMATFRRQVIQLNSRLSLLQDVINRFLSAGDDKDVSITPEGSLRVFSTLVKDEIPIYKLSSGERQIIIFFTMLIIALQGDRYGILTEDEPEISLHVAWQRDFIRSALDTKSNAQLIFATHSPSILTGHERYAVQVERTLYKGGKE